jgi:PEP-CTERM motif
MNIKSLALASTLAFGAAPAFAGDQVIDLSSGIGSFIGSATLLDGGDDVITFANLADGVYNFVLTLSGQNIQWNGVDLNGQAATVLYFGEVSFGYLESVGQTPFILTLTGTPGTQAAYSGELTVTAVPEPGTLALLLAGLGVIGFVARRRAA